MSSKIKLSNKSHCAKNPANTAFCFQIEINSCVKMGIVYKKWNFLQAHEVIALEILTLLLENATEDSVEVAISFLKECGQKLTEVSPKGINGRLLKQHIV